MKNLGFLILAAVGFAISFTGFFLQINHPKASTIVMLIGGAVLLFFYIISFYQVIKTKMISRKQRIFWILVILCVPIVANLIYLFIFDALTRRQKPPQEVPE